MNKKKKIFLFIITLAIPNFGCDNQDNIGFKYSINPTSDSSQPNGIYIPKDIDDCFIEMKRMLHPEFIKKIKESKEQDLVIHHMGLGMWIRNNWGLWSGSHLMKYFYTLGFRHTDDISSAIIYSFWKHLNGLPIEIEKQGEASKNYWRMQEPAELEE